MLQEIGGYAWHKVADLPATREEGNQTFVSDDGTKHKFFMVGCRCSHSWSDPYSSVCDTVGAAAVFTWEVQLQALHFAAL